MVRFGCLGHFFSKRTSFLERLKIRTIYHLPFVFLPQEFVPDREWDVFGINSVGSAVCRDNFGSGSNLGAVSGFGGTGLGIGRGGKTCNNKYSNIDIPKYSLDGHCY